MFHYFRPSVWGTGGRGSYGILDSIPFHYDTLPQYTMAHHDAPPHQHHPSVVSVGPHAPPDSMPSTKCNYCPTKLRLREVKAKAMMWDPRKPTAWPLLETSLLSCTFHSCATGTMTFYQNGECLGVAFEKVNTIHMSNPRGADLLVCASALHPIMYNNVLFLKLAVTCHLLALDFGAV